MPLEYYPSFNIQFNYLKVSLKWNNIKVYIFYLNFNVNSKDFLKEKVLKKCGSIELSLCINTK